MGAKSKIEWCDSTWNPITGCLHGCEYCYARKIAQRFGAVRIGGMNGQICELNEPYRRSKDGQINPYPYEFLPTLHRYLLDKPQHWKKPRNIFAGSMADMWGAWVPDEWKIEVMEACRKAPQHNYLFLTKDPLGYHIWPTKEHPDYSDVGARTDNMWLGVTYTGTEITPREHQEWDNNFWYIWRMGANILPGNHHTFISIEPLRRDICEVEDERDGGKILENFLRPGSFGTPSKFFEWAIIGAETGNRKDKVTPKREWVDKIVELCDRGSIPVFMKESLLPVMGEENMRRDIPPELGGAAW